MQLRSKVACWVACCYALVSPWPATLQRLHSLHRPFCTSSESISAADLGPIMPVISAPARTQPRSRAGGKQRLRGKPVAVTVGVWVGQALSGAWARSVSDCDSRRVRVRRRRARRPGVRRAWDRSRNHRDCHGAQYRIRIGLSVAMPLARGPKLGKHKAVARKPGPGAAAVENDPDWRWTPSLIEGYPWYILSHT